MKKKIMVVFCAFLLVAAIGAYLYVDIGGKIVEKKMWDYLIQANYSEIEIKSIEVKHSFLNVFLSYKEWSVEVVYDDEPTSIYIYTIKDGKIVESGVSGATKKEDLKH